MRMISHGLNEYSCIKKMLEHFETKYIYPIFSIPRDITQTHLEFFLEDWGAKNKVLLLLFSRTNSESQCGKVIHKKSVGRAGNSNFLNFPLSPLIFYELLSRIDFQSPSVKIIITKPYCLYLRACTPTRTDSDGSGTPLATCTST